MGMAQIVVAHRRVHMHLNMVSIQAGVRGLRHVRICIRAIVRHHPHMAITVVLGRSIVG